MACTKWKTKNINFVLLDGVSVEVMSPGGARQVPNGTKKENRLGSGPTVLVFKSLDSAWENQVCRVE